MQIKQSLAIVLLGAGCVTSDASYSKIAGYAPGSKVTSHNAIDLDQAALENVLGVSPIDYGLVKKIYEQGGNSKPYAEFVVPKLTQALKKGDQVVGATSGASGMVYSDTAQDATKLKVAYSTSDTQETYVSCKGGALQDAPAGTTATAMTPYKLATKCFLKEDLPVSSSGSSIVLKPTAAPVQKAGRTLQGFSTKAGGTMYLKGDNGGCKGASDRATDGCPYVDFSQYYSYFGEFDYANKIVLAAIGKSSLTLKSKVIDLSTYGSDAIRSQVIKKGTAYMNAYMYAIREFEDAIDDCRAGCPGGKDDTAAGKDCNALSINSVHAWDEGVAFYTGSLEGANAGGDSGGKLSYRLAEKRCGNFKTCGTAGDSTQGASFVNTELFKLLGSGQNRLLTGKCDEAKTIVGDMVALMSVPLIQGTLRYAYKVDKLQGGEKEKAEGAIFALAIAPRVASCDQTAADTIMTNMKLGASATDFSAVKKAFESTYKCMKVPCARVGGLWFSAESKYYDGAEPCVGDGSGTDSVDRAPRASGALSLAALAASLAAVGRLLAR